MIRYALEKEPASFYIVERSLFAFIATRYLRKPAVAMVLGRGIHIYGISKEHFLLDKRWLMHELQHIRQFETYGFFSFLMLYLWESMRRGYYNNRFEVEARAAEHDVFEEAGQKDVVIGL